MDELRLIRTLLSEGRVEEAVGRLNAFIESNPSSDEAFYLLGNAYRKQENWEMALNNYAQAIELNPESVARHAYQATLEVLDFFNKDMFNQ